MNKKILILGASSDIGLALLDDLEIGNFTLGLHCNDGKERLINYLKKKEKVKFKIFKKSLNNQKSSKDLFNKFIKWSKGIDIFVHLTGNVSAAVFWENLQEKNWKSDIEINLGAPFFISQLVFKHMKKNGGKIVLMSTASAKHGGGPNTIGYGMAKAGLETLTKRIARDGGKYNILANAIAPGFIDTRFHSKRINLTKSQIKKRIKISTLKKAGNPKEVAKLINYLISSENNFMTGEVLEVSGGDWL